MNIDDDKITISVKTLKGLIKGELEKFYIDVNQAVCKSIICDAGRRFPYIAYTVLYEKLESCNDYESLQDYLDFAGYRMSLQEWIDSL